MHAFTKLQVVRKQFSSKELRCFHEKAVVASQNLKASEAALIRALQEVDKYLVHRFIGYNSLFQYAVRALGLSEHQAYGFITVARKALKLPALQAAIESGEVTVSKVRKVTSVINEHNQMKWLELARTSTRLELEKAIALENPRASIPEGMRFVTENVLDLRAAVSEETYQLLMEAKAIQSQGRSNPTIDDVLKVVLREHNERHNPVKKAERAQARIHKRVRPQAQLPTPNVRGPGRVRIAAKLMHQVNLRDQGQCQFEFSDGEKCGESRWLDVHHIKEVSCGGTNEMQNLRTLCKGHHQLMHS